MNNRVQPFPFERLPKTTRREADLIRRCARRIPRLDAAAALATAIKLLGAPISCQPRLWEICPTGQVPRRWIEPVIALLLEKGSGGPGDQVLVDIPAELAAVATDRALGGEGEPAAGQALFAMDDLSRGVLGYLAARLLQSLDSVFRLRAVLTERRSVLEVLGEKSSAILPVDLRIGFHSFTPRLWIPDATAQTLETRSGRGIWSALRQTRFTLTAKAGAAALRVGELYSLKPTDVVIPDRCDLSLRQRGWTGAVDLMLAGATRARWKCTAEDRKLRVDSVELSQEAAMTEGRTLLEQEPEQLLKLAGDAPVELSVEIARFTLPLEELGALRPGEILVTRRPIGEQVTLRAGGYAVASGELVDVDGEVGVRILSTAHRAAVE